MRKLRKVLAVVVILAMVLPGIGQAASLSAEESIRIEGSNRYKTAVAASKIAYKDGADTVVLATGEVFADALTGTVLAAKENAPLLLTKSAKIQEEVLAEIERLDAGKVIVLGGEVAVSKDVLTQLEDKGLTVERVCGENRYETAKAVAERLEEGKSSSQGTEESVKKAFLVSGVNFRDALSIGPVAAREGIPVFLTKAGELRAETKEALEELGIKEVVFIGGPVAISKDVVDAVEELEIGTDRVHGENGIETAIAVAEKYFADPQVVFVASDALFADGLVGGYLAAKLGGPVLLTKPAKTDAKVTKYISDSKVEAYVLGGEKAVSNDVVKDIEESVEFEEPVEIKPEIKIASLNKNSEGDLVLRVEASAENLYSLEIDHSHGKHGKYAELKEDEWVLKGTEIPALPEFTIYADPANPWGELNEGMNPEDFGVTVEYDAGIQSWTLTFQADGQVMDVINHEDISNGAIDFLLVVNDQDGNSSGSMNDGSYVTVSQPENEEVLPEIKSAEVIKDASGNLLVTVEASDDNLFSLEVDHSHGSFGKWKEAKLPEFTIYADESNPWGILKEGMNPEDFGVSAEYDADSQTWTLTFHADGQVMDVINNEDISNGAIEFYLLAHDKLGNSSGSMNDGSYEKLVFTPES